MLFAYDSQPDLLNKVRAIAEGYGNADVIQDLSDLNILGKSNPGPLQKVNLDMGLLDKAASLAESMSEVLAKANGLREADSEYKIMRDRAYTYLREAVDEIRRCGQYKFWRNPERKKGYASKYGRRRNKSRNKNTDTLI